MSFAKELIDKEVYLGDGLYAKYDGYQFTLRAQREDGDHYVCMEPEVFEMFEEFVDKCLGEKL